MKILQQPVKAKRNEIIQVHFDKPVVVRLLSKSMFKKYKNGGRFQGQGGMYEDSPAKFTVPYDGLWHAVIEKKSHFNPINVSGRVELLPPEIRETPYFDPDAEEETPVLEDSTEELKNEWEDNVDDDDDDNDDDDNDDDAADDAADDADDVDEDDDDDDNDRKD